MLWLGCSLLLAALAAVAAAEKLVGSAKCQQDSVPWEVSLQSVHHVCSGALISQEWVLSSAQCSRSSPDHMEVWLGLQVPETLPKEKQQVIAAAKLVPHKQFNNYTLDYDIMLIKLAQPAVLADGTDNLLQCSYLPVTSDATCNNVYPGRFTERMLCAGQLDSSQDACKGDVGSPLVCEEALQGLLSWKKSCSEENRLGLYTKVCIFEDWIHYTIANN
uniref:anionic trypsin-like isoform X4 n=1 Tax=Podarcis muralis TaxID=64176 RepID=UPI0010A08928|nr:anionic trypsin-like isoform X4 [Podarcis muralis]